MALTEYDRLNDAVKRKKAAALGDIEEAAGMQVAQASPPNIGGLAGKRQNAIDAAEKAAVSPAAPKAAAPAAPDVDPDKAIGISIPKYVPPKPVEKPGLLKRIFGDAGEDAAPALGAAAAAGTAMVPYNAVTGQAPGVPKPPLEPMKTYPDLAKAARAKDAAAYAAQAANAASPAAAAAEPVAAKAASETARLGERVAGAANKVLDVPGKAAGAAKAGAAGLMKLAAPLALGAAAVQTGATPTEDFKKRYAGTAFAADPVQKLSIDELDNPQAVAQNNFDELVSDVRLRARGAVDTLTGGLLGAAIGAGGAKAAPPQPAVPGAQPAAGEPAGPPASLAGPTAAVGAPARVDQRVIDDEKRAELIRGEKAPPPNGVALGDFGVPGTEIVGRSTRPDGKINDFSGTGTGAAPQGNGVTLGLTAADIAADKANTMRRLAIGRTPDAPTFQNSKAVVDGLNKLQDLAAKMQSPAISRKERKALQAQIAVLNANVARFNDVDRTNFAAAEAAHRSALGQYNAAGAAFDQRAALGLKSAADYEAAKAAGLKAQNDAKAAETAAADKRDEKTRQYADDSQKEAHTTLENAAKGRFGDSPQAAQYAAQMKTIFDTKPFIGADGKPKLFKDLSPKERSLHMGEIKLQALLADANRNRGGILGSVPGSDSGQNAAPRDAGVLEQLSYLANNPSRLGDVIDPRKGRVMRSGTSGGFLTGSEIDDDMRLYLAELEKRQKRK